MAGERVFRFRVAVDDAVRGRVEDVDLRLARHPSETDEHLVLRVLARCLLGDATARLSPGVCRGDEPPLSVPGDGPAPRLWIEVGRPSPARLERAARRAEAVAVLAEAGWRPAPPRARRPVSVLELPAGLPARLAARLERTTRWRLRRTAAELAVEGPGWTESGPLLARELPAGP